MVTFTGERDVIRGGSRIFIGEGLQMLGAPFRRRDVVFRRLSMGEKVAFRARKAPLLAGELPYLLRRASSWEKRAPFRIVSEGCRKASLARGRTYLTPSMQK